MPSSMHRVRHFVAIASRTPIDLESLPTSDDRAPGMGIAWRDFAERRLVLGVCGRADDDEIGAGPWVVGDDAELRAAGDAERTADGSQSVVNAVSVAFDSARSTIRIATSIVSLPPVYVATFADRTIATDDLHLLSRLPGVELRFDPAGVRDLGHTGFPVRGRTLFRDVRFAEAAHTLELDRDASLRTERNWALHSEAEPLSQNDFVEAQIAAFESAMARIDTSQSILSLTGGLDTRTIFAVLAAEGRIPPSITLSGALPSLDARLAADLCEHYDVAHQVIRFDETFVESLPERLRTTSRLSGGLASLDWANEVYLYEAQPRIPAARISGNLGNQVGRGGTEGFGVRNADLALLAAPYQASSDEARAELTRHWLDEARTPTGIAPDFLLHHEIPYTSVANFSIGNHFAIQQSPYADRALVETLARKPAPTEGGGQSLLRLRLRDLRHRFFGEPETESFQRRLVARLGGFPAQYPINWGWRAAGGIAPAASLRGVATLLGMVASSRGLDEGRLRPLFARAVSLHDFRRKRFWLRSRLEEFARDELGSTAVRESGLFDPAHLDRALDEHFGGERDHHQTVVFALDLALARSEFGAR